VIGAETGPARTCNHDLDPGEAFTLDKASGQVCADDYDALLIPGGTVGADKLRCDADAVRLIRGFFEAGKPAGVICHGPWTRVEADVVRARAGASGQAHAEVCIAVGEDQYQIPIFPDISTASSRAANIEPGARS
jgi:putative intracellular protease/amidase